MIFFIYMAEYRQYFHKNFNEFKYDLLLGMKTLKNEDELFRLDDLLFYLKFPI